MPSYLILPPELVNLNGELAKIYNKDFFSFRYGRHPIGLLLKDIVNWLSERDLFSAYGLIIHLDFHLKHLREIKKFSDEMFRVFVRLILKSTTLNEFEAARFEVNVGASLARKGIHFKKTESPDFTISYLTEEKKSQGFYIECTSLHIQKSKKLDTGYKISSAIRKKSKKAYSDGTTALFIDVTEVSYRDTLYSIKRSKERIKEELEEAMKNSNFGSVLLFRFSIQIENRNVAILQNFKIERNGIRSMSEQFSYIRVDQKNISENFKKFLDEFYPIIGGGVDIPPGSLIPGGG